MATGRAGKKKSKTASPKAWTQNDYVTLAGRGTILLRLKKESLKVLTDEAEARGISRQQLVEELLEQLEKKTRK